MDYIKNKNKNGLGYKLIRLGQVTGLLVFALSKNIQV